jgi:hypothetical protein
MARSLVRVWPLLFVLALVATPATADLFYVTLTNGNVVESAYEPQEASWDSSMVLLMTEVGNWIGIPKDKIEKVESGTQKSGFGVRINSTTVAIGWAPNDAEDPNAVPADGQPNSALEQRVNDAIQNLNQFVDNSHERQNYSVDQFVEPDQTQGIPGDLINPYSSVPPSQ